MPHSLTVTSKIKAPPPSCGKAIFHIFVYRDEVSRKKSKRKTQAFGDSTYGRFGPFGK